jgi:hypothetical protein
MVSNPKATRGSVKAKTENFKSFSHPSQLSLLESDPRNLLALNLHSHKSQEQPDAHSIAASSKVNTIENSNSKGQGYDYNGTILELSKRRCANLVGKLLVTNIS